MSSGWSWWVMGLIVINLGVTFFLFLWAPRAKVPVLPDGTTGHVWAGGAVREALHPLPLWWIAASFVMYFSAFTYLALYPGFGKNVGALRWTASKELAAATAANDAKLKPVLERLAALKVEDLGADAQAQQLGARLFVDNCAACHGRGATGNQVLGAPNLTDGDWLYGGTAQDIVTSIHNGRMGVMPPWNSLGEETVAGLVQYVLSLSGRPHDATIAAVGEPVFKTTCAACHGPEGKGNPLMGAPNLTDDIWLHGGTPAAIETTIRNGRQGHMPAWDKRLTDTEIHLLAGYVYSLSHRGNAAAQ